MTRRLLTLLPLLAVGVSSPAFAKGPKAATPQQLMADVEKGKDLYATLDTTLGTIVLHLFTKDAPKTVGNFVGLATGAKEWKDLKTGEMKNSVPFYDGLTFHRVIPGFMIQGGDPMGSGIGGPGYRFEDENQKPIDKAGLVAMANAGPNTNGSQFYITESPQARLRTYNLFGEVVTGQDVVDKIGNTPRDGRDLPLTPVIIQKVTITEAPPKS